ncbi:uncharacterized protein LOC796577 [Anopheles sinensis]|uniref:Uncharacterized protein LOC796577 n=1 Tax=Anopheles sinensis TaxID=74873 RepID=A0A084VEL3_ANOSI|nr:uncharacterized protein LOC796577 [Anopheles sinensis]
MSIFAEDLHMIRRSGRSLARRRKGIVFHFPPVVWRRLACPPANPTLTVPLPVEDRRRTIAHDGAPRLSARGESGPGSSIIHSHHHSHSSLWASSSGNNIIDIIIIGIGTIAKPDPRSQVGADQRRLSSDN